MGLGKKLSQLMDCPLPTNNTHTRSDYSPPVTYWVESNQLWVMEDEIDRIPRVCKFLFPIASINIIAESNRSAIRCALSVSSIWGRTNSYLWRWCYRKWRSHITGSMLCACPAFPALFSYYSSSTVFSFSLIWLCDYVTSGSTTSTNTSLFVPIYYSRSDYSPPVTYWVESNQLWVMEDEIDRIPRQK
jgi:hypothetical protein